jgi:hypothetical protein
MGFQRLFLPKGVVVTDNSTKSSQSTRETAYHEAGHCVAGIVWGENIDYATITPLKLSSGFVIAGHVTGLKSTGAEDQPFSLFVPCCAGAVCGAHIAGKPTDPKSLLINPENAGDIENLRLSILAKNPDLNEQIQHAVVLGALDITRQIMTEPEMWSAVAAVAEALISEITLPGDEIRRIVTTSLSQSIGEDEC